MISIRKLSFHYSKQPLLFDNFNMEVEQGDLFGLLGPNGAGKSTLISIICGLIAVDSGDIFINGRCFSNKRKLILQNLSIVPQEYAFYLKLTGHENLNFFVSLYKNIPSKKEAISQAVELTGISSFMDRQVQFYSGGMKRRLNLAIGLLNSPELLILDEPTVGIDPQSRHFILDAIRQINKQGTTVLYTSHYMEEVERLCNRVAVIDNGKILASGLLAELLINDSIRVRVKVSNIALLKSTAIMDITNQYKLQLKGDEFGGEINNVTQLADIITAFIDVGANLSHIQCGEQNLESLFFELTSKQLREE